MFKNHERGFSYLKPFCGNYKGEKALCWYEEDFTAIYRSFWKVQDLFFSCFKSVY